MSLRRSISWASALRDLRADRAPAAGRRAYFILQQAERIEAIRAKAGAARGLWRAGTFDRRAIMAYAVANARVERANALANGRTLAWAFCMADALKHAWATAHAARRAATH